MSPKRVDPKSKSQMKKLVGPWKGYHANTKQNIEVSTHKHGLEIAWEDGMRVTVDNADTAKQYLDQDSARRGAWSRRK